MMPRTTLLLTRPWLGFTLVCLAVIVLCRPALENAFFDLDDYRYLYQVRRIANGEPGAWWEACVVENRWDDAWWLPSGTFVRFFRPPVIASYWLDAMVWGHEPFGYALTNVLLHLVATGLLCACLWRLFGARWVVFFGTLAFGLQASHWENLAYVAGRTDTLAAIPVLAAVLIHLTYRATGAHSRAQLWTAALCFLAFLSKEYTAVVPVLLLLLDWLAPSPGPGNALRDVLRRNARLIIASAAWFGVYLALRDAAFGDGGAGAHPYPYFYSPWRAGFLPRTGAALLQYAHGLAAGEFIQPFLNRPQDLSPAVGERILSALWVTGVVGWGFWTREGRWLAVVFVSTLLPLLVVYTSGRYLYLPSVGYCALLGLAVDRIPPHLEGKLARAAVISLMVLLPAARLHARFEALPRQVGFGIERHGLRALLDAGLGLDAGRPIVLLDFPGTWFEAQFAAPTLAVVEDVLLPKLHVLTRTAGASSSPTLTARVLDEHSLELWRSGAALIGHDPTFDFDPAHLPRGTTVRRAGYSVTVTEAAAGTPVRAHVRFDAPLSELRVHALPGARLHRAAPMIP